MSKRSWRTLETNRRTQQAAHASKFTDTKQRRDLVASLAAAGKSFKLDAVRARLDRADEIDRVHTERRQREHAPLDLGKP